MITGIVTTDTHYGMSANTHSAHEKFLEKVAQTVSEQNIQFIAHCGDWTSSKQDQFYRSMSMFRKYLPNIPIITVRGNHDFWDYDLWFQFRKKGRSRSYSKYSCKTYGLMMEQHRKWFEQFGIHHVDMGEFVIDDVVFLGFDGWYDHLDPPTNDKQMMYGFIESAPTFHYLNYKAHKDLEKLLATDTDRYRAVVGMTHFPSFTEDEKYRLFCANAKYHQFLTEKCDVLLLGHSHRQVDCVENECRVVNPGSDYDSPRFVTITI